MKKELTVVAVLSILIQSTAFASPLLPQSSRFSALSKEPAAKPEGCANLSGNWKGTCDFSIPGQAPQTNDDQIQIEQGGCDWIITDGQQIQYIGGMETKSLSYPSDRETDITVVRWSKDRSALKMSETDYLTQLDVPSSVSRRFTSGEARIQNGQLIMKGQARGDFDFSFTCTYDRQ